MKYYVDCSCMKSGDGSKDAPFLTIQEAANVAKAGDTVEVYPGIYREDVNPIYKGEEGNPVTYHSVEPLKAVITGAEVVTGWEQMEKNIWKISVENKIFGDYNPYTTLVSGDWFIAFFIAHTGDVFLNGKSMYEVTSMEEVIAPKKSKASWDPEFSVYVWFTKQSEDGTKTEFYCNFQGKNPNEELTEITVRRHCFYPREEGCNYITLSGFNVNKAATQWAPPTAYQEGMIGPHWSKGWIIEDCEVSESKCSGISLGKYKQENNDNKWLKTKYKDGTQTEREVICQAQIEGWSKERIGSHIIRRCHIHDCGQSGIVGHLGGVFSIIEDNHIHHINNKQNLAGAEIGGIKMHAAIDVIYRRNHIHHCTRGLWLDWQAQGTRVTQNFFHHNTLPILQGDEAVGSEIFQGNGEDIFIEVSHGPTLVDHNILLSEHAMKIPAQGIALVDNIVAGGFTAIGLGTDNGAKYLPSPRYTPYHVPHRTEIAGFMSFLHGDDRFYNNLFIQQEVKECLVKFGEYMLENGGGWDDANVTVGTFKFDDYPTFEEWNKEFEGYCGMGSAPSDRYYMHLPVWAAGNVYYNGAKPWAKEKDAIIDNTNKIEIAAVLSNDPDAIDGWKVVTNLYEHIPEGHRVEVNSDILGNAFEPEQRFENPDGTDIIF